MAFLSPFDPVCVGDADTDMHQVETGQRGSYSLQCPSMSIKARNLSSQILQLCTCAQHGGGSSLNINLIFTLLLPICLSHATPRYDMHATAGPAARRRQVRPFGCASLSMGNWWLRMGDENDADGGFGLTRCCTFLPESPRSLGV